MHWYLKVLDNYAEFSGRARRKEYWMFLLWSFLFAFVLACIEALFRGAAQSNHSILVDIYNLAVMIPTLAVGVRRMHDTDHSGWWLLVPIANLVLAVREGERSDNRFGPDPKATAP